MMKMRHPSLAITALLITPIMLALGCASIIEGRTQSITFNSEPSGAQIVINGVPMGVTPATITIKKSEYDNANVQFKKEGYQEQHASLHTKVTGWFWGNVISGGLLGSATDAISGAMWEYSPDKYFVTMPPAKASIGEIARLGYENRVRIYILFSHEHLVSDLAKGGGEHLSSLCSLLELDKVRQGEAIPQLRLLATTSETAPAFAEAVLKAFVNG
jgi:PEGA domain